MGVRLTCGPGPGSCTDTGTLTVSESLSRGNVVGVAASVKKKTVVVGRRSLKLAAGHKATLRITLTRTGKALLARFRKLPLKLAVTQKVRRRRYLIASRRVTLRAPPRKHKRG